jgi:uncharacterized protein YdeI (YjbR/CyaY-like superfamily)
LVLAKKGVVGPTQLTYDQALDAALCQGWIDGQVGRRDEATYRQRFTPRRLHSRWSRGNVARIERLLREGRMLPAGVAAVDRARADGSWQLAYAGSSTIEVPLDLAAALDHSPDAKAFFDVLTSRNRYAILFRIGLAKRAETRQRRITTYVAMLARGETIHPQGRLS